MLFEKYPRSGFLSSQFNGVRGWLVFWKIIFYKLCMCSNSATIALADADVVSQFHEICGNNVRLSHPQIIHLYRMSNCNLMQAINIYLDGHYKPPVPPVDASKDTSVYCLGQCQMEGHSLVNNLKASDFQDLHLEIQGTQYTSGLLTKSGRRVRRTCHLYIVTWILIDWTFKSLIRNNLWTTFTKRTGKNRPCVLVCARTSASVHSTTIRRHS